MLYTHGGSITGRHSESFDRNVNYSASISLFMTFEVVLDIYEALHRLNSPAIYSYSLYYRYAETLNNRPNHNDHVGKPVLIYLFSSRNSLSMSCK